MPLPLRQLRAIAIAIKRGRRGIRQGFQAVRREAQIPRQIDATMAAARATRIRKYGKIEEMSAHAKTLLDKHANIASKRSGARLAKSVERQTSYVRHVQKRMQSTLKASKTTGPYGNLVIHQVKVSKKLVRRTS